MSAIIDSNKFNFRNKIGEFEYIDIKDLVNNIRNNTISEISAKKGLNKLNEIKNAGIIKYKKRTPKQKELLNLFNDLLDTILTDKTLKSKSQKDNTLMSSKDDNDNDNENDNENENKDDDENDNNIIKQLNDSLDEIIDKSKSFDNQKKSIRKVENLNEYWFVHDYGDKELEFKIFKLKLAHLSNIIDKKLFKQIFGHTFETLANKLINTTNKEENQITVNNINESKEKLYEEKEDEMRAFYDYVIQPSDQRNNLIEAINLILDFNKIIQLDLIWKYKNQKMSE